MRADIDRPEPPLEITIWHIVRSTECTFNLRLQHSVTCTSIPDPRVRALAQEREDSDAPWSAATAHPRPLRCITCPYSARFGCCCFLRRIFCENRGSESNIGWTLDKVAGARYHPSDRVASAFVCLFVFTRIAQLGPLPVCSSARWRHARERERERCILV